MPQTRRLTGIAALSAGALASAGLSAPAIGAEALEGETARAPAGDIPPEELLSKWESERGIDLPDESFLKIDDVSDASLDGGALIKWEYQPASDTSDALLIKWERDPSEELGSPHAFLKVESGMDSEGAARLRSYEEAFLKIEDAFLKIESAGPDATADGAFIKWEYASGDEPTADAFIKWQYPAQEPLTAGPFIKWEYDALDLVESALLQMGDPSAVDGDPDQPIVAALDAVRALQVATLRIDPFATKDPVLRGLPLPKKLPADVGSYTSPKAGIWRSVNLPGAVACGGLSQRIARTVSDNVELQLQDDGRRIVGRNLAEKGSQVVLDADPQITGRYTGTVDLKVPGGGRVEMDLTMQLITDERIVSQAEVTVRVQGQRCTVSRGFDMTWKGR